MRLELDIDATDMLLMQEMLVGQLSSLWRHSEESGLDWTAEYADKYRMLNRLIDQMVKQGMLFESRFDHLDAYETARTWWAMITPETVE